MTLSSYSPKLEVNTTKINLEPFAKYLLSKRDSFSNLASGPNQSCFTLYFLSFIYLFLFTTLPYNSMIHHSGWSEIQNLPCILKLKWCMGCTSVIPESCDSCGAQGAQAGPGTRNSGQLTGYSVTHSKEEVKTKN